MKQYILIFFSLFVFQYLFSQNKKIHGFVYLDENKNEIFDKGEHTIPNVAISNGRDVVQTNDKGRYDLKIDDDETVFLIKPSGYITKLSEHNVPVNYAFNKPKGSPDFKFPGVKAQEIGDPYNFPLYKNEGEDTLKIALLGDTQTKTIDEVYYLSKVVSEKMLGEDYDFIVPLGDITYDNLRLFDPIKRILGKVGAPVYYVYGNHDRNYDAKELEHRDETYESNFGSSYYAFTYGNHSFITLNNVFPKPYYRYDAIIDEDQMQFVKEFLNTIPSENSVHLLMHIPLEQLINLKEFSELFKNHPNVFAYAGHTHTQFFETIEEEDGWISNGPVEELVAGAVCGSWWHGEKDMFGIPQAMMADGTPKGFWVMNLEENRKTYEYEVSEPDNRQMHIWTPFDFERELIEIDTMAIIANVYAGNKDAKVEVKIGDREWQKMIYSKDLDPYFLRLNKLQKMEITPTENSVKLGKPKESEHLWKFPIPEDLEPGIHTITVRASNKYGLDATAYTLFFHTDNTVYFTDK
ncbi:calcineurin-like phosphoesterase C-terminal domain-containing protein [Christiangramia echinicola]|uniref:N terminal of Calcineurin-like phosphoesterase n=1 Tax=Christiangramia echinicola TaxID=279359 RepID=A0A1H1MLT6_9FLAO|nr:calcineurin-like phosphoesterase family protein [Christiangramia echinicola]SDR87781.1 N terminal of Calcineurin-like phosphoesterase [Christiangramia echinicola]